MFLNACGVRLVLSLTHLQRHVQDYFDVNDTALVPVVVQPELPPPDHIIDLNVFFATMDNGINR